MSWLERLRQRPSSHSTAEEHVGATQAPVEWISPGLSALFEALSGDRGYSILDLADHAGNSHLEVLGQFSRQIRFAGLTPSPPHGDAFASALLELPPGPCAYDVVLAWDVMDRLGPHERERLMDCLVEVTAPRAWLHAVVDSSGDESAPPLRLTLIDLDRVSQQAVGPPEPLAPQLLPRHVECVFRPFEIVHAYTLRARWREYVARRR